MTEFKTLFSVFNLELPHFGFRNYFVFVTAFRVSEKEHTVHCTIFTSVS